MRESKRRRLDAKGWRTSSATEFLSLLPRKRVDEIKLRLADSLRQLRVRRRLTQAAAAKLLKSSQSRIAKMEAGDPSVSLDLMIRCLSGWVPSARDLARAIAGIGLREQPSELAITRRRASYAGRVPPHAKGIRNLASPSQPQPRAQDPGF